MSINQNINVDVYRLAHGIVEREGGFVNDPHDPGGATNFGVTIGTIRRLGLDLTGDGRINIRDVRAMTKQKAVDIFVTEYYHRPKIHLLPEPLQAPVFDMQVNAGANAVKILQRLLTKVGFPCVADGAIGPKTKAAAAEAFAKFPDQLVDAYGYARINYYHSIASYRPESRKYFKTRKDEKGGWVKRAEAFMSPHWRLSTQQFQDMIKGWE